jgi:hypothetical protein
MALRILIMIQIKVSFDKLKLAGAIWRKVEDGGKHAEIHAIAQKEQAMGNTIC